MTSSPEPVVHYHVMDVGPPNAAANFVYPQVESMGPDYDLDNPASVAAIGTNRPLGFAPNLDAFHLNAATEVTDLLSQTIIAAAGLLASQGFCDALRDMIVVENQSFPARVVHRGVSYDYRWMHFIDAVENRIDFARSRFMVKRYDGGAERKPIADDDEVRATVHRLANTSGGDLAVDVCAFRRGTPRFDLLTLCMPAPTFYLSVRLADRLMRRGLTGFELGTATVDMVFPA